MVLQTATWELHIHAWLGDLQLHLILLLLPQTEAAQAWDCQQRAALLARIPGAWPMHVFAQVIEWLAGL